MPLSEESQKSGYYPYLVALIACSLAYFLSEANIFETFTPRYMGMHSNAKLITMNFVYNLGVFIASGGIGVMLLMLNHYLKSKGIPFTDYFAKFGLLFLLGSFGRLMALLSLYKTYYWIDSAIGLITAWYAFLLFLTMLRHFKEMKSVRTPAEFHELAQKVDIVIKHLNKDFAQKN